MGVYFTRFYKICIVTLLLGVLTVLFQTIPSYPGHTVGISADKIQDRHGSSVGVNYRQSSQAASWRLVRLISESRKLGAALSGRKERVMLVA